MRRVCDRGHDASMDIVSVLLGILMFAILISLVYGIDRI